MLFTASSGAGLPGSRGITIGYLVISLTMIATPLMIKPGGRIAGRLKPVQVAGQTEPAGDLYCDLVVVGLDQDGLQAGPGTSGQGGEQPAVANRKLTTGARSFRILTRRPDTCAQIW